MRLTTGAHVGPYEILGLIGAGGMGEVYRARDPRLQRAVAVKVLPATYSSDRERLQRFEQEARAAAAISHPNIVAVYDVGRDASSELELSSALGALDRRRRYTPRCAASA